MVRKAKDVTDAELAVLEQLWENGAQSARGLAEVLYGSSSASNCSTVQKLLGRLEEKRCVKRDRDSWPHTFVAAVKREELIGRRLQSTADELCEGSLEPLLTHLVTHTQLSQSDRKRLHDLLNRLDDTND